MANERNPNDPYRSNPADDPYRHQFSPMTPIAARSPPRQ